ncbi:MAG: hypothetical protein R2932_00255 [Caldilineaceae bacterium]
MITRIGCGKRGEDLAKGNWQPVALEPLAPELRALGRSIIPLLSLEHFCLAQRVAAALTAGETIIEEAANFYDGLVVQRMLDTCAPESSRTGVGTIIID